MPKVFDPIFKKQLVDAYPQIKNLLRAVRSFIAYSERDDTVNYFAVEEARRESYEDLHAALAELDEMHGIEVEAHCQIEEQAERPKKVHPKGEGYRRFIRPDTIPL